MVGTSRVRYCKDCGKDVATLVANRRPKDGRNYDMAKEPRRFIRHYVDGKECPSSRQLVPGNPWGGTPPKEGEPA